MIVIVSQGKTALALVRTSSRASLLLRNHPRDLPRKEYGFSSFQDRKKTEAAEIHRKLPVSRSSATVASSSRGNSASSPKRINPGTPSKSGAKKSIQEDRRQTSTKKLNIQAIDLKSTEPSFGFPRSPNFSKDGPGTDRNLMNIFSKDSELISTQSHRPSEAFEAESAGYVATARGFNYFGPDDGGDGPRRKMTDELDNPRKGVFKPEKPPVRLSAMLDSQEGLSHHGNSPLSKSLNESRIDHINLGVPHILTPKNVSSFIDMLDYSLSEADISHFRYREDGQQGLNSSLSMSRIRVPAQDISMIRSRPEGGDTTRDLIVETFGPSSAHKESTIENQRRSSNISQLSNSTLNNTSITYGNAAQLDEKMLEHPLCKFAGILPPKKIKHSTKLIIQKEHYPQPVEGLWMEGLRPIEPMIMLADDALPEDKTRETIINFQAAPKELSRKTRPSVESRTGFSSNRDSELGHSSSQKTVIPFLDWTTGLMAPPPETPGGPEPSEQEAKQTDDELQDILQIMMDDNFLTNKQHSTAKKREPRTVAPILAYEERPTREDQYFDAGVPVASRRLAFMQEEVIPEVTEGSNSGNAGAMSEDDAAPREPLAYGESKGDAQQDQSRSELNLQTISNIENDEKQDSQAPENSGSLVLESDTSML